MMPPAPCREKPVPFAGSGTPLAAVALLVTLAMIVIALHR